MTKIQLNDSVQDIVIKMSCGNPGALMALVEMLKKGKAIDPDGLGGGLGSIILLDTFGIYGTDIYVLFSDICKRDIAKTLAVIRAAQLGFVSGDTLKDACSRQDWSGQDMVPVDDLYAQVKERLPNFNTTD